MLANIFLPVERAYQPFSTNPPGCAIYFTNEFRCSKKYSDESTKIIIRRRNASHELSLMQPSLLLLHEPDRAELQLS